MSLISAPEFRGNIERYAVRRFIGADAAVFALFCAIALGLLPLPSHGAGNPPTFIRIPSPGCAVPFTLHDLDGRERSLAARKGRLLAVHFFATWCEPCEAELATLQRFYEMRGDKIDVLAIDVGEVRARVRSFLMKIPVRFPVLLDPDRAVTKAWAVEGLPTTFVLDDTLRPVLRVTRDVEWTSAEVAAEIENSLDHSASRKADCTKEHTQ